MIIEIFKYKNYKTYLSDKLDSRSLNERGFKQKAAEHIGCQPSYLSQILNGKPHLSVDQAHQLNQLFLHDKVEAKFFIILVELGRASTKSLKEFFIEQLEELKQTRFDLKKRLQQSDQISAEAMNKYYSTWYFAAIHIALAVPAMQDPVTLARHFNLPEEIVASTIQFLEECGLIEKKEGEYAFTKMRIHLGRESDFIQRHHINWRSQSLQAVEKNLATNTHFSTVFAVSKTDYEHIKEIFIKAIADAREIIKPSKSEELCAITLDIFKP